MSVLDKMKSKGGNGDYDWWEGSGGWEWKGQTMKSLQATIRDPWFYSGQIGRHYVFLFFFFSFYFVFSTQVT